MRSWKSLKSAVTAINRFKSYNYYKNDHFIVFEIDIYGNSNFVYETKIDG